MCMLCGTKNPEIKDRLFLYQLVHSVLLLKSPLLVLLCMVNTMYNVQQLHLKADRCSFKLT